MRRGLVSGLLAVGLTVLAVSATPNDADFAPSLDGVSHATPERRLVQSVLDIENGRWDLAFDRVTRLLRERPDFHLAHLVYGDLLAARAGRLTPLEGSHRGDGRLAYLDEMKARLGHYRRSPSAEMLPAQLLKIPDSAAVALLVDLTAYRLYVYENHRPRPQHAQDYYVSIGKGGIAKQREGDEKTPIGVYRVSSYLPGSGLPDMYGVGAFPIDYPNGWDRLKGRTGSGIWIHGTESDRYSRPPLSSRGCVTLSNEDFGRLGEHVEVSRTPVVVAQSLDWVPAEQVESVRGDLERRIEAWRLDWESRDAERYLRHYDPTFRSPEMGFAAFAAHKRVVNPSKAYIKVHLDDLGIFGYPGEEDLVVVDFVQHYDSNNFRGTRRKQQYWRRDEEGDWLIVFEG